MMKRAVWAMLLVDLAALGAVLWDGQRHLGQAARHEEMLRSTVDLATSVALLNEQVLGARAGVVSHYDGVVTAGCSVDAHAVQLRSITRDPCLPPAAKAQLEEQLADLNMVLETQRGLVEHFKSEMSVLRNSQRYLPVVVRELSNAGRPGPTQDRRADALQELLHAVLVFALQPDSASAPRLEAAIVAVGALGQDLGPADLESLALAQRHARVVVERRQMVDGLVSRLLKVPVRERTHHVREAILRHRATADAQAGSQVRVAAAQGGLALLLGLLLLWRPRRTPAPLAPSPQASAVQEPRVLLGVAVRHLEDAQTALRPRELAAGLAALSQRVAAAAGAGGFDFAALGPGIFLLHAPDQPARNLAAVVHALHVGPALAWEEGEPVVWLGVIHHGVVLLTPDHPPSGHAVQHLLAVLLGGPQDGGLMCTPAAWPVVGRGLALEPASPGPTGPPTAALLRVRL